MKTAVIGASGYAGGELLRLLATHPVFEVTVVSAHSNAGEQVTSVHPQLQSYAGRVFVTAESIDFTTIAELAPAQREAIKKENKVANPGCYATSISLGIAPAISVVDCADIVVVAASGTTGAGRSAKINLIGSEVMNSLTSYKFGGVHQHTPEIEQALSAVAHKQATISFTPILAPMPRGILSTITAKLVKPLNTKQAHDLFSHHYADEFFVDLLPLGQMPKTSAVTGSNKVQIQVAVDEHTNRLVVSVAIDNLGKGAAGQAIQNANLICGLSEISGLALDGVGA